MDLEIYKFRVRELLPFISKAPVRAAIEKLESQIEEESTMRKLESQLAVRILETVKAKKEFTRMEFVKRVVHEYLLFENFVLSPLHAGNYELKGHGGTIYLFKVVYDEGFHNRDAIYVTLVRPELKTKLGCREKKEGSYKFYVYPKFKSDTVGSDQEIVFKELKALRVAFKMAWNNLNLPNTPSSSVEPSISSEPSTSNKND